MHAEVLVLLYVCWGREDGRACYTKQIVGDEDVEVVEKPIKNVVVEDAETREKTRALAWAKSLTGGSVVAVRAPDGEEDDDEGAGGLSQLGCSTETPGGESTKLRWIGIGESGIA